VPRLIYRAAPRRAIAEIAAHIERESKSRAIADDFHRQADGNYVIFLRYATDYRESMARLPGQMGRPRPELGRDVRSTTYGNYVIFLRYADEDAPRSHLYVTRIVHGARDMDAYFLQHRDDD
jgi:toxin ParE1/3/4